MGVQIQKKYSDSTLFSLFIKFFHHLHINKSKFLFKFGHFRGSKVKKPFQKFVLLILEVPITCIHVTTLHTGLNHENS